MLQLCACSTCIKYDRCRRAPAPDASLPCWQCLSDADNEAESKPASDRSVCVADPSTMLGRIGRLVASMAVGEFLTVSIVDLNEISTIEHNGARFTPPDRVLENIMGSALTHSYEVSAFNHSVTFFRHANTGAVRYRSPDRRGS